MSQEIVRGKRIPREYQVQLGSMVFGYMSQNNNMEIFDEKMKQFQKEGKIPDLNMEAEYTIYRWKSRFGRHESIVFGFQGKFFTIEIRAMNQKWILYTTAEDIDEEKLQNIGKKVATGAFIITKAIEVYNSRENNYGYAAYNCQNFSNDILKAIEMNDQVANTDSDWLMKIGSVALVGMTALFGLSMMRTNRKQ